MNVLVFKTDISEDQVSELESIFDQHPFIIVWNVDTNDVDRVLRVEVSNNLSEGEVIRLVLPKGFNCEVLND